jgi:hypothetical protein
LQLIHRLSVSLPSFTASPESASPRTGTEQWKAIQGKIGEERIFYNPDSVIPSGPSGFRVWVMDFKKDYLPRKSLEEFDCANRIVRDLEVIVERSSKPMIHTFTPSDWRGVSRDAPRDELLRILCR